MTVIDANPRRTNTPTPERPLGLCLTCNYPLWGLPTPRCPECGREFDPLDASTMNMGRELTLLARWALGPLRWPVNLLSWAAIVYALWTARLPGGAIVRSYSIYILIGLGCFWFIWPVVRIIVARNYGWPQSLVMRGQKQRVTVGCALLLASMVIIDDLPMKAAVWFSRPAMDRIAAQVLSGGQTDPRGEWVGVFHATRITTTLGGGMRFTCVEAHHAYRSGFVYLPKVDPNHTSWNTRNYRHVSGPWWAWREEG